MKLLSALIVSFIMALSVPANAQYQEAIGLRAGLPNGISYKKFTGGSNAIEGILHLSGGIGLTGVYLIHAPAFDVANLNWYYGGGGHVHLYGGQRYYYGPYRGRWRSGPYYGTRGDFDLGLTGMFGLEYKIPPIPFVIGLDISPLLGINSYGGTYFGVGSSFSIRWTFRE
jgi:hypothetical protein